MAPAMKQEAQVKNKRTFLSRLAIRQEEEERVPLAGGTCLAE